MINHKIWLTLLLCLLLCACLLPAAYADGSTVQELQNAIANGQDFTLSAPRRVQHLTGGNPVRKGLTSHR
jgi:hypothetical protein